MAVGGECTCVTENTASTGNAMAQDVWSVRFSAGHIDRRTHNAILRHLQRRSSFFVGIY